MGHCGWYLKAFIFVNTLSVVRCGITVSQQPQAFTALSPHSISSASSFTVNVQATNSSGGSGLSYEWSKSNTSDFSVVSEWPEDLERTSASFTISTVISGDEGFYRCKISQSDASTFSGVAQLQVNTGGAPIWFSSESDRKHIVPTVMTQLKGLLLLQWLRPFENGHPTTGLRYAVEWKRTNDQTWRPAVSSADDKLQFAILEVCVFVVLFTFITSVLTLKWPNDYLGCKYWLR
jgi:hypothetical protein